MNRTAGVLMPVFSLPSKYGIGCFDQAAYDFVDYLAEAGQTYWQILPLSPTSNGRSANSPYQSYSAFAGNPFFINLDELIAEGVLTQEEVDSLNYGQKPREINYNLLTENRMKILHMAYERSNISEDPGYQEFLRNNEWWLSDYALFIALLNYFDCDTWMDWPEDIRLHYQYAIDYYHRELYYQVEFEKYLQYKFTVQWFRLKAYANSRNIRIIGDIPIYVSHNSTEVWAHPELFQLDENHVPLTTAGCPPDNFSADGQVWWSPLYNWEHHRNTGFDWWSSRLYHVFNLYDVVRIDHFRAFDEYFSIPYNSNSAADGHWEAGPGMDFFRTIEWRLGRKDIIVEDLGFMTDTVRRLVEDTGYPNMKVFQFGFDEADYGFGNDYLIHNYPTNCVSYTGTHDNETILGWYQGLNESMKTLVRNYVCDHFTPDNKMNWVFISNVMKSPSTMCIIPIQDYLGLDNTGRINTPSTDIGNWCWRITNAQLTDNMKQDILAATRRYGRLNWQNASLVLNR